MLTIWSIRFRSFLGDRAGEKCNKRGKGFLQGPFVPQDKLKPIESTQFTSAPFEAQDELKHRPPEEKDFFRRSLMHDGSAFRATLCRLCAICLRRRSNRGEKDNAETRSALRCAEKKDERARGQSLHRKKTERCISLLQHAGAPQLARFRQAEIPAVLHDYDRARTHQWRRA